MKHHSCARRGWILSCVAVALLLVGPGWASAMTISKTFTNHSGITINDLHWEFNTVENVTAINKDFWPTGVSSNDGTNTFIDFSGFNLQNGASTSVGVTFADSNSSERDVWWTKDSVKVGSAYDPLSYRSSYGSATQEWIVTLDNKNIVAAGRLLVKNLRFAVSSIKFDANNLGAAGSGGLTFGAPVPDFIIEIGSEASFNVFTGAPDVFVVSEADLNRVDGSGVPISLTESAFRAQVVPEPSSLLMLGLGLAGAGLMRRSRSTA